MGKLCIDWLKTMVEALVRNTTVTKFIKSFREGSKSFLNLNNTKMAEISNMGKRKITLSSSNHEAVIFEILSLSYEN